MRGTVRRNLTYSRPDVDAAEIARVVYASGLDRVLGELPDGITTWVVEGGRNLSVGQRQCIALGRALLGNPPILLLDEPTANLDPAAKEEFRRMIVRHQGTVLLATTDPAEIAMADQVWVLDRGRVRRGAQRRGIPRPGVARVPAGAVARGFAARGLAAACAVAAGDTGGRRVVATRLPLRFRTTADGPPLSYRAFVPSRGLPAPTAGARARHRPRGGAAVPGLPAARHRPRCAADRAGVPGGAVRRLPVARRCRRPAGRHGRVRGHIGRRGVAPAAADGADRPARLLRRRPVRAPLRHAGARARAAGGRRLRRLVHLPRPGPAVPARRGARRAERGPAGRRRGIPAHPHACARR